MNKNQIQKNFASAVKVQRGRLCITQEKLAERANLHRTYISDIERGSRNLSLQNINKLAKALEIPVSSLFPSLVISPTDLPQSSVEILLVEGNPEDVEKTLQAFKKVRFSNHVQVVRDGGEALDYLFRKGRYSRRVQNESPQIILLDLSLPKVSSLDLLRRLKADLQTRHIPVVILINSKKDHQITECRLLGVESFIVKPVDFENLSLVTPGLNLNWVLLKQPTLNARNVPAKADG